MKQMTATQICLIQTENNIKNEKFSTGHIIYLYTFSIALLTHETIFG